MKLKLRLNNLIEILKQHDEVIAEYGETSITCADLAHGLERNRKKISMLMKLYGKRIAEYIKKELRGTQQLSKTEGFTEMKNHEN